MEEKNNTLDFSMIIMVKLTNKLFKIKFEVAAFLFL